MKKKPGKKQRPSARFIGVDKLTDAKCGIPGKHLSSPFTGIERTTFSWLTAPTKTFGDNAATALVSSSGYFRVFIHWMDDPEGYVWSVDDGNQRTEDVFKGVEFRDVRVVSAFVPPTDTPVLKDWEPRLWLIVRGAVLDIADGIAKFRPPEAL